MESVAARVSPRQRQGLVTPMQVRQINTSAIIAAATAFVALGTQQAPAAGFGNLQPHRAAYDLVLKEATERSGIKAMNGRIVYEITGNECLGLTVRYRFVTNITTAERSYQTDQHTETFESADGDEFSFETKTFVNKQPEKVVRGVALRTDAGVTVDLEKPVEQHLELEAAAFISTHMMELLEAAGQGKQFVRRDVFDGSDDADEVVRTSAVIGIVSTGSAPVEGENADAVAKIEDRQAWPVNVSYFEKNLSAASESLPVYEASFLLYENGISRHLVMRYSDYALKGELASLELLDPEPCPVAQ